jgi:hypothetical protein
LDWKYVVSTAIAVVGIAISMWWPALTEQRSLSGRVSSVPLQIEQTNAVPDVQALQWEVARLRALVLYADQLQRMLTTLPGQQGDLLESIRQKLADEPCVKEFPMLPPDA